MRMLQTITTLNLQGDSCYSVFSCDAFYPSAYNVKGAKCRPMTFTLESSLTAFRAAVDEDIYADDDRNAQEFYSKLEEIVSGACQDWYLYAFDVKPSSVVLFYCSSNSTTSDHWRVVLNACPFLEFRISVPRTIDESSLEYLIKMYGGSEDVEHVTVSELRETSRRELCFCNEDQLEITEWSRE